MIENLRKQTGLMSVILLLLAAGLILTMNDSSGSGGGDGKDYMKVGDVSLNRQEVSKEYDLTQRILSELGRYDYLFMFRNIEVSPDPAVNTVAARILLKNKAAEFGLNPSDDAAETYIKERIFVNQESGEFDAEGYTNFIDGLKQSGYKEQDLIDIIAEYLVFTKMRDIVASGVTIPQSSTIDLIKSDLQKVSVETVSFKYEDFSKNINPTDEEIKAYWETHKDAYLSDRQLKLSYLLVHADDSDRPKEAPLSPDASTEERTQANIAYNQQLDAWKQGRQGVIQALKKVYSEFYEKVQDSDGKEFTAAAENAAKIGGNDIRFVTTEPFSITTAPAELQELQVQGEQGAQPLLSALFDFKVGDTLLYKISQFSIGEDGYFAFRVDENILPQVKTYEAAKELAKADLIKQRANEALTKAAESAKSDIAKIMQGGKSFSDAVKEKGLTSTAIAPFGGSDKPEGVIAPELIFNAAKVTEPKSLAKDIVAQDASTSSIVYLDSRIYEIAEDADLQQNGFLDQQSQTLAMSVFTAWLRTLPEGAEMKLPRFTE